MTRARVGDQRTVLFSVGLTELVHGIYRAQTTEARSRRDSFIRELLNDVEVYPYTKETALLAGKIDGEQQSRGIIIPFGDLWLESQSAESAIEFVRRLQRPQIAGLKNRGSCSIPTTPINPLSCQSIC